MGWIIFISIIIFRLFSTHLFSRNFYEIFLLRYEVSLESEDCYNKGCFFKNYFTPLRWEKILYSAGGFQDFLNSVKNAVLMPENAKKNHKEIGYPVVPCIRPDFDWLFDIYLLIDMKNSKSKNERSQTSGHLFYVGCLKKFFGEMKWSVAV
jgi:hypothetical protein